MPKKTGAGFSWGGFNPTNPTTAGYYDPSMGLVQSPYTKAAGTNSNKTKATTNTKSSRNISYTTRDTGQEIWNLVQSLTPFGALGAIGGGLPRTIGNAINAGVQGRSGSDAFYNAFGDGRESAEEQAVTVLDEALANNSIWNRMTKAEKIAAISAATSKDTDPLTQASNMWGWTGQSNIIDIEKAIQDFTTAEEVLRGEGVDSLKPVDYAQVDQDLYDRYYQPIFDRIDQEQADARDMYNTQLRDSTDMYNRNANAVLGNQYRQNAMIQDSLRSDLARTRQNALEAGASAGLRIAGNVNATLAAQNKAAQTSMETANNLSQLLLNQRQAAAGIRNDYRGYMTESNRDRDTKQSEYLGRRASERQLAQDDYDNRLKQAEDRITVKVGDGNIAQPYAEGALRKNIYSN